MIATCQQADNSSETERGLGAQLQTHEGERERHRDQMGEGEGERDTEEDCGRLGHSCRPYHPVLVSLCCSTRHASSCRVLD